MRKQYAIYTEIGALDSVYSSKGEAEKWVKEIPGGFVMVYKYLTPLQIKNISYVQAVDFESKMTYAINDITKYGN